MTPGWLFPRFLRVLGKQEVGKELRCVQFNVPVPSRAGAPMKSPFKDQRDLGDLGGLGDLGDLGLQNQQLPWPEPCCF